MDQRQVTLTGHPRLDPDSRLLEIYFTALSFLTPDKVRFRYRLEGLDEEWVEAGTRRSAYYTNLRPGNYTFRVLASNNDGVWSPAGAVLTFQLAPHFYQTSWFIALCVTWRPPWRPGAGACACIT